MVSSVGSSSPSFDPSRSPERRTQISLEDASVLVADASHQMAEIKRIALRAAGLKSVRLAAGVAQSMESLKRQTFDFILMDEMVTPRGFSPLVALIREQNPGQNTHTPVLVAVARLDAALLQAARDASVAGVLQKPFSGNDIRRRIVQVMGRVGRPGGATNNDAEEVRL